MAEKRHIAPDENLKQAALQPADTLSQKLRLQPGGLSADAVRRHRKQYGSNRVGGPGSGPSPLHSLRKAFVNPFSIILFILAAVSCITDCWLRSNFSKNGISVVIILLTLLISGSIRLVQELKAGHAAESLSDQLRTEVRVWRDGGLVRLPAEDLVIGDQVCLEAGDRVPADMRLLTAEGLVVSQALLTGESHLLKKAAEPLPPAAHRGLNDYTNIAFTGSTVISGQGKGVVVALGENTVYGGYLAEVQRGKSQFDQEANAVTRVFIRFMLTLVPVVFIVSGITKGDWMTSLLFSVSVAVGLTPELLPLVINVCLARGSAAMWKKQTIVKNINAMQRFGSMDVLCVDKTGTLTGDAIRLEYYLDILGEESQEVLDLAYLNSFYHTGLHNGLDRAVLTCADMPGRGAHFTDLAARTEKLDELPFDYDRKCVSVLVKMPGKEPCILTKGDVQSVYGRCSHVRYRGETVPIDPEDATSVHAIVDEMTEDGMKVLAVACKAAGSRRVLTEADETALTLLGYVVFFDAPKRSAASALKKLQALSVPVKVLTGDRKSVTLSICRRIGLDTAQTITGEAFDGLDDDEQLLAAENNTVFAELTPAQKSRIIRILRENGHVVGFLGDGMNDLAAMTAADVAISVDTAARAVKESADVLLLKKDLNVLEQGILEGRKAFANMLKYIRITASSNFGNIFSVVLASAFLPFLPMTAVQLLLLNLLYDLLCMTLPWDRVDRQVYARPNAWSEKTLGRFMRFFGPLSSVVDLLTFVFLYTVLCPSLLGGPFWELSAAAQGQYMEIFHTGWFLESLWTQVLILHLLRTEKTSILKNRAAGIVWLLTGLGLLLLTALVYTPAAGWFGLTPLPGYYFVVLAAAVGIYMLLVTAAKKWYVHRYGTLS